MGLERLVEPQDADYIGKAALEEIRARRASTASSSASRWTARRCRSSCRASAARSTTANAVGTVTDLIWSPRLERNIGYVWMPIGLAGPGTPLEIEAPDGGRWPARTAAIPFLDPKKDVPEVMTTTGVRSPRRRSPPSASRTAPRRCCPAGRITTRRSTTSSGANGSGATGWSSGARRTRRLPARISWPTLDDEPLLIARGRDGELRAFYNVCRHRGTAVVEEPCGQAVRFQCPYHAWIYDLEGQLVRAKHTDDLDDFDLKDFGLVAVRMETWQGFVFVCLSPETPPLIEWLGDLPPHLARFDFARLRVAHTVTYEVETNWKFVAENYSECYHCPGIHPQLNKLTPYDLGGDFAPTGPWQGGWMELVDERRDDGDRRRPSRRPPGRSLA